jgi:hypothetical protein
MDEKLESAICDAVDVPRDVARLILDFRNPHFMFKVVIEMPRPTDTMPDWIADASMAHYTGCPYMFCFLYSRKLNAEYILNELNLVLDRMYSTDRDFRKAAGAAIIFDADHITDQEVYGRFDRMANSLTDFDACRRFEHEENMDVLIPPDDDYNESIIDLCCDLFRPPDLGEHSTE